MDNITKEVKNCCEEKNDHIFIAFIYLQMGIIASCIRKYFIGDVS